MEIIYNFNFLKILNIVLPADVVKLVLKNVYLYLKLEVYLINNFEQKKMSTNARNFSLQKLPFLRFLTVCMQ